jgi:hypothetical protein
MRQKVYVSDYYYHPTLSRLQFLMNDSTIPHYFEGIHVKILDLPFLEFQLNIIARMYVCMRI